MMKSKLPHDRLLPDALVAEIETAAKEERRDPGELVAEAVQRYLSERRAFRPDEVHQKIARGLDSLREGKGVDGEAILAELLAELDPTPPHR